MTIAYSSISPALMAAAARVAPATSMGAVHLKYAAVARTGYAVSGRARRVGMCRRHNTWHTTGPRVGAAVVFNLSASGTFASHVGLVVAVSGGSFTMISGNTFNPADGKDDIVGSTTLSNSAAGISGFTDPATAAPAPNSNVAFDYFVGLGLSKVQSAGIVGNLNQESGASMNPQAAQAGSLGRGIAQWEIGGRWDHNASDNVVWYAGQKSQSQWALNLQLGFTWYELTTFSNYGLVPLRAAETVTDAVVAFQNRFEGCSVCMQSNRIRYADQALAAFG